MTEDVEALARRYAAERAKRLRPDGIDQYQPLSGRFAGYGRDPLADPGHRREPVDEACEVAIVGAGLSGLLVGHHLREAGIGDVRLIERGTEVGGTWYWNRYPAAACDVDASIYLPLLDELGIVPSEKYARAPEIRAHLRRIAEQAGLPPRTLFQTAVTEAIWDAAAARWIVRTDRGDRIAARFLVACIGLLGTPKLPAIAGIEGFAGHAFHTSRWDHDYTGEALEKLADKSVALVGTGSTGIQVAPPLARAARRLAIVQRTPATADRRDNRPTDPAWAASLAPDWARARRDNFTLLTSGGTAPVDLIGDAWTRTFRSLAGPDPEAADRRKMAELRARIDAVVIDPAIAEALKPWYGYNCKRPGFSDDYLPIFNRPNVTLLDTAGKGIERIVPEGIVVGGRAYAIDCLIFATGFEFMTGFARQAGFDPVGSDGRRLSEHWGEGARTLFGIQTHGFPNFLFTGLVQAGASINYTHIADEQARHLAALVAGAQRIATVQPSAEAEAGWVGEVMALGVERRAFLEACTPGYYNFEGRRGREQTLNDLHHAGPIAYIERLRAWRAAGVMAGLETTPKPKQETLMPTRDQIEQAMHTHFDAWNAGDRARWATNFADAIVFEDPVGGPTKEGVEAVRLSWDNSFKDGQSWRIEPLLMQICADQAACHVRSTGVMGGETIVIEGIEVYTIDDAGKVVHIRTWFTPPEGVALDPYFMEAHKE